MPTFLGHHLRPLNHCTFNYRAITGLNLYSISLRRSLRQLNPVLYDKKMEPNEIFKVYAQS